MVGISILAMLSSTFLVLGWDSSDAETSDIDVFMISGQSNGAYSHRAVPDQADPVSKPGMAFYYGDAVSPVPYSDWTESGTYGIYDMVNADGSAHIGGIEQPFAATYVAKTGHKICIINTAVGGAKMVDWSINEVYYERAKLVFADAMSKLVENGFTPDVKGLIWIQGESDPTWQIQAYKNRFMTMFNAMSHAEGRAATFNDDYAFDNCIMSLVRQHRGQNTCLSQIQLDAEHDNVKLGCIVCDTFNYENGLLYNDDTHYTQLGRNIVAKDLANNYIAKFMT